MFKTFWEKYLNFNIKEASGVDLEINKVILVLALGFCIATFFINLKQLKISAVLRGLVRRGAHSPDTAVSERKLGIKKNKIGRSLLEKREGFLKNLIKCKEDEITSVPKGDGEETNEKDGNVPENSLQKAKHYYIPEEMRSEAEKQIERNNGSLTKAILGSVLIMAFAIALILLIPVIL